MMISYSYPQLSIYNEWRRYYCMFSRFSIKFSIILTFLFGPIFLQTASGIEQYYPERKRNFPDKTESIIDVQLTIDVSSEIKHLHRKTNMYPWAGEVSSIGAEKM